MFGESAVGFLNNKAFFLKFVSTVGGHMIVMNMLSFVSILRASKKPVTANFEEQYAVRYIKPISPE